MMDFAKYFPIGYSLRELPGGSVMLHYGNDGTVYISPDGYISSRPNVIRKLATHFARVSPELEVIHVSPTALVLHNQ